MSKTNGANITQINAIKRYYDEGYSPENISDYTRVKLEIVSKFIDHFKKGGEVKSRPVDIKVRPTPKVETTEDRVAEFVEESAEEKPKFRKKPTAE